jgi:5-carboxyvanillate decarboxylase
MKDYKRIATEEAWATREQIKLFRKLLDDGYDDPGYKSLWGFYLNSTSERARFIIDRLQDLGPNRIAEMDASGIDTGELRPSRIRSFRASGRPG